MTLQLQKKNISYTFFSFYIYLKAKEILVKKNEHKNLDSSLTCLSMKYHVNALIVSAPSLSS